MKLLTVFPLLAILLTGALLLIPSEINAELPDSYYKDQAYSIRSSHLIIDKEIVSTIELSNNILSVLSFENSIAKKKIENALDLRSRALFYNQEFRNEEWQIESMLENKQYKNSYNRLLDSDKQFYNAKKNLDGVILEIKEARDLQIQDNQLCFLFWCYEIKSKYIYSVLNPQIQELESKLDTIENRLISLETNKNTIAQFFYQTEVSLKNQQLQNLENLRKQQQYDADVKESQLQEQIRQEQLKAKRQEQLRKQQQYEADMKERQLQEQNRLDAEKNQYKLAAKSTPLIKGLMNGKLSFYVNPLPSYASQEVRDIVERLATYFDGKYINGVKLERTYSYYDFSINWVKDYQEDAIGRQVGSHLIVGLGTTGCGNNWKPFDALTVRRIMYHEVGHALGQAHNNDPNNIMYGGGTGNKFEYDYSDTIIISDGRSIAIPFCHGGDVFITTEAIHNSAGYKVYVIPPGSNPSEIIKLKQPFYLDCSYYTDAVRSLSGKCNVKSGSFLLLQNPSTFGTGADTVIKVKLIDRNPAKSMDYSFDPDSRYFSQEYLNRVVTLFR